MVTKEGNGSIWTSDRIETGRQFYQAIATGDVVKVRLMCAQFPWLKTDYTSNGETTWVGTAAKYGNIDLMGALLDCGFNIDAIGLPEKSTALCTSIGLKYLDFVYFLLSRGANPNIDRPLISALRFEPKDRRLELIRALVDHGADVNRLYDVYGDKDNQFTVLDWAQSQPEIASYLREKGAKTLEELKSSPSIISTPSAPNTKEKKPAIADEVVQYFAKTFGPVDKQSLIEIVPSGHPVAIHIIRPSGDRKHYTLFTTGLSTKPMQVPSGQEEYALAEIFIELPGNWEVMNFKEKKWNWPLFWLRKMAQYPHNADSWLGGPLTIIANEDPPLPLAPGVKFTSMLLLAEQSFVRSDGKTVQLNRAIPLYTDERDLELREGAPALMRAFDRKSVPFIVDLNRPSVAGK